MNPSPRKRFSGEESRGAGNPTFHYNREERLASASEAVRRRGEHETFFRRYRTSLLILLDVAILAGMVGLYSLLKSDDSRAKLPGYEVVLHAVQFGNQALVSVLIRQSETKPSLAGDIVRVDASIPGTTLSTSEKDVLPVKKGNSRTIRLVLQPLPKAMAEGHPPGTAVVNVHAGTSSVRVSMKMKAE